MIPFETVLIGSVSYIDNLSLSNQINREKKMIPVWFSLAKNKTLQ